MELWPHQQRFVEQLPGLLAANDDILCAAPTGCHAAGDRVLLCNGESVRVEDVSVGDTLLGPGGSPRVVLQLCRGFGAMWRITPKRAAPFTVNTDHILTLVRTRQTARYTKKRGAKAAENGAIIDVPLREYLKWSKWQKHIHKLVQSYAEFDSDDSKLTVPPRLLGILLGDGSLQYEVSVTTGDSEIERYVHEQAHRYGLKVRVDSVKPGCRALHFSAGAFGPRRGRNRLRAEIQHLGLFGTTCESKFIPRDYLTASRNSRLKLLAGLIDTDGCAGKGGFDFISKSEALASGVRFLACSLGLKARMSCQRKTWQNGYGYYYRVSISGDCSIVPCLIPRKRLPPRQQKKNTLRTGFSVEYAGKGEFFGFTLSGDGRYLLEDFTITHNSGKGVCIEKALEQAPTAVLYTDRRMLLDQTAERLREAGFDFGFRASGLPVKVLAPIQLCMIQTEDSRVLKSESREHFKANLVVLDEAHRMNGPTVQEFRARHKADGAKTLGFTATPLDLGGSYQKLVVLATNSECRQCGAHVVCQTFAPDEPDLRGVKRMATGDYEVGELSKIYRRPVIFGRVMENWRRVKADDRPTMLFGPDVAGAMWFAEQFEAHGIPAGHIDGEQVIIRGEVMPSTQETRQQLHDALKCGEVKIVCNRLVLREGIDWPWVSCLIFATAFGSLTSYLQSGGRGLRTAPGKTDLLVLDHGGNFHRHGSLNADREWKLDATDRQMVKDREDRLRNKDETGEQEPIVCPACAKVRSSGNQCPYCGHVSRGRTRVVVQTDGSLREMKGDIYRPRKVSHDPADVKAWKACYYRCRRTGRTFNQAMALFARENGWKYPDPNWPLMPRDSATRYRKVSDVPYTELNRGDAA